MTSKWIDTAGTPMKSEGKADVCEVSRSAYVGCFSP